MTLSVKEYADMFPYKGNILSRQAIIRRCMENLLPSDHHARQLPSDAKGKGQWVIDIPDEEKIKKTEVKNVRSLNIKHFSW